MRFSKVLASTLSLLLAACIPSPDVDDNGDRSWVQQALTEVLGRKIRGWEETNFLAQATAKVGRRKVSRAMMTSPGFIDHWTDLMLDDLEVQRGGGRSAIKGCWDAPKAPDDDGALAEWIRTHNPQGNPVGTPAGARPATGFNMIDVIRSALILDDMSVVYRANLIPLQMNPGFEENEITDDQLRETMGAHFERIYLGRNQSCMGCHNQFASSSGPTRTLAPPEADERALYPTGFTASSGSGMFSSAAVAAGREPFNPKFRLRSAISQKFYPWEFDRSCVSKSQPIFGYYFDGLSSDPPQSSSRDASLGEIRGKQTSILDVESALHDGVRNGWGPTGQLTSSNPGNASMAYLTAFKLSQNIWENVMGEKLTIAHGYSRNSDQLAILRHLTKDRLLPNGWSLRKPLEAILTSSWFNRSAPYVGDDKINGSPYHLQMVLDPWVGDDAVGSVEPEHTRNGQGRVVHRYAVRILERSVSEALDHRLPPHFAGPRSDDARRAEALGQYLNDYMPGTRSVDFQAMLSWSDLNGQCSQPEGMGDDWIDRMVDAALAFDRTYPAASPLTLRDVVLTMKDWFLTEPSLDAELPMNAETDATEAVFGGTPLDTRIVDMPPGALRSQSRDYCGVLLSSPQFMLAGIRPTIEGPTAPPRLRVCNPGQPCTWQEICEYWAPYLGEVTDTTVACHGELRHFWMVPNSNFPPPVLEPPSPLEGVSKKF